MKYLLIAVLVCSSSLLLAMNEKAVSQQPALRDHVVIDIPDSEVEHSFDVYDGVLNLSNRNLRSCSAVILHANNHVVKLDLSHNQIQRFKLCRLLKAFPALCSLDCSHNAIRSLRCSMVKGMPAGFTLNLSDNQITKVREGVEAVLTTVRDCGIRIYCDNTSLPQNKLIKIAAAVEGASRRRLYRTIAMRGGTWTLFAAACGCAMARGVLQENEQLPVWGNAILFSGFFVFLAGSLALLTMDTLSDCWVHDLSLPNRFSCENS